MFSCGAFIMCITVFISRSFRLAMTILLVAAAINANAQPGGRPGGGPGRPGGPGGPGGAPREIPRCPPADLGPRTLTSEEINAHFANLKADLKLSGEAIAAYDRFAQQAAKFLEDDAKRRLAPRSVSQRGSAQLDRLFDEARNRYTAIEDLQDAMKAMMANLNDSQRALADSRLLPTPSAQPPR
jgi:hypothetical protein